MRPKSFFVCVGWVAVVVMVSARLMPSADAASLRLVATLDGQTYEQFSVSKNQILAHDSSGEKALSRSVRWRLEGDLLAEVDGLFLRPYYQLTTAVTEIPVPEKRTFATVWIERNGPWKDRELSGAIAVLLWVVDGRPVRVLPVPASTSNGPSGDIAAITAWGLDAESRRGAPLVLLLKDDHWLTPSPSFADETVRAAIAEMHLGSAESFERLLERLKSLKITGKTANETLLHLAAEAGFDRAARALIARGAKVDAVDWYGRTPMHWAARNDRRECVTTLRAAGARAGYPDHDRKGPRDLAIDQGHGRSAFELLVENPGGELNEVFRLAVEQGDTDLLVLLLKRTDPRRVERLPRSLFDDAAKWENPEFKAVVAMAGVTPQAKTSRSASFKENSEDAGPVFSAEAIDVPPQRRDAIPMRPSEIAAYYLPRPLSVPDRTDGRNPPVIRDATPTDHWALATLIVEKDGTPGSIQVVDGVSDRFRKAIEKALQRCSFLPGEHDGAPVRSRMTMVITIPP